MIATAKKTPLDSVLEEEEKRTNMYIRQNDTEFIFIQHRRPRINSIAPLCKQIPFSVCLQLFLAPLPPTTMWYFIVEVLCAACHGKVNAYGGSCF